MTQRSPAIFWLLLVATLAVDAVAIVWILGTRLRGPSTTFFIGLAYGQVNVLCAWAVLFAPRIGFRWLAPFAVGVCVGVLLAVAEGTPASILASEVLTYTGLIWAQVAFTFPVLWLLGAMRSFSSLSERNQKPRWQFGTKHLLILMTCLAALLVVLGRSKELSDHTGEVIALVICNTLLLLATIIAVSKSQLHILLRLALSLAAALAIAIPCEWFGIALAGELDTFSFNLIQVIVMWAWLEWMRRPSRSDVASADETPLPEAGA